MAQAQELVFMKISSKLEKAVLQNAFHPNINLARVSKALEPRKFPILPVRRKPFFITFCESVSGSMLARNML